MIVRIRGGHIVKNPVSPALGSLLRQEHAAQLKIKTPRLPGMPRQPRLNAGTAAMRGVSALSRGIPLPSESDRGVGNALGESGSALGGWGTPIP